MSKFRLIKFLPIILITTACATTAPVPTPVPITETLQYGIPFQHIPATSDIVMYEINPGAFSLSGNFNGITAGLDSVKSLGINTIWLMPVFPVGTLKSFGSPYCVKNYSELNPEYGTLADYRNLVSEAHKRDIAVIMDWVGNHTSWDNPWIQNKSWYTQDVNGKIISPAGTNWTDVADLNYTNKDMRAAMIKAMKFWALTANIDGFRCDAADFIPYDFWKQAIDTLHTMKGRNFILLAEGARTDHFTAGFQLNYGWDFLNTLKNVFIGNNPASQIFDTNAAEYSSMHSTNRKLRFTTNHDESGIATPVELFNGLQGAMAASVITICLQGAPLLYCGQEVGVSNRFMYSSQRPVNWTMNPDTRKIYRQILRFYNSSNALRNGILHTYSDNNILAFNKTFQGENVLILVNCRNKISTFSLPAPFINSSWINIQDLKPVTLTSSITLQPYRFYILRIK